MSRVAMLYRPPRMRSGRITRMCYGVPNIPPRSRSPPDLLILDYRLGNFAGPDLLPGLQSIWGRSVPVVIVSGEHPTLLRKALRETPWPVLAKPIRPEELRTGMLTMLSLTEDS